jgi:predicted adenylyl cyclase CyaB
MKDVEIEIQVRISQTSKLESFLEREAKLTFEEYQKDEYFTPLHRNFVATEPVAEWLRLRQSDQGSVTYKNWHYGADGRSQYCDEYETGLTDIDQMRQIFGALDMKPVITVEKARQSWRYQDYEISLDHVTSLGDFVEVEYKGSTENADPQAITDGMIALLKQIDCGTIERNYVGYAFMMLHPDNVKFEKV